ncbi:MAG: N-acetylglucosamine kinase [Bacteroidota bacterium]
MILIADSGSTKTEWVLLEQQHVVAELYTQGLNPYFQTIEQVAAVISEELMPQLPAVKAPLITDVFYYGAGCSSTDKCEMIRVPLVQTFTKATVTVEHDLLAAARAACGTNKGIAAILGTGSNSCLFDGKDILANQPSLGFILGDEGSGGHIGKELLKQFVYSELPADVYELFLREYMLNKEIILEHVYKKPMPNRYAASFARFAGKHIAHPHIQQLVMDCFREFFKRHISSYPEYTSYTLSAVGSIAYIFSIQLEAVAREFAIPVKHIIQKPMEGLIHYHTQA